MARYRYTYIKYKYSERATLLSKFISVFSGFVIFASICLVTQGGLLTIVGILILFSIIMVLANYSKILTLVANQEIRSKIVNDNEFCLIYFLDNPITIREILALNPGFKATFQSIISKQWYCCHCRTWNTIEKSICDCGNKQA